MTDKKEGWSAGRRSAVWLNVVLQALFLLGFVAVATLLARRSGKRFDLTTHRIHELSNLTEDALRALEYEIEIWVTSTDYSMVDDKSLQAAFQRTLNLLHEFTRRTPRLKVNVVGEGDPEITRLQRLWPHPAANTLYLHAKERNSKKSVDLYQLYHGNPSTGIIESFHAENVLLQAIRELGVTTKRIFYETEGHQELSTEDARALGVLKNYVVATEGTEFRRFPSATARNVPEDCDLLLILGPSQPFTAHEVGLLKLYLERGGSIFVALRPRSTHGLEGFLEEYGVKVWKNVMFDPVDHAPGNPSILVVRRFHMHDINRGMLNSVIVMPDCSAVGVLEKGASWKTVPLARTGPQSWPETSQFNPGDRARPDAEGEERSEHSVIVAVEKPATSPRDERHKTARLVVWGSAAALTNYVLHPGFLQEGQVQYLVNNFRWLMDRELLEIQPKKSAPRPPDVSPSTLDKLKWVAILGFPSLGIALGLLTWFLRRK